MTNVATRRDHRRAFVSGVAALVLALATMLVGAPATVTHAQTAFDPAHVQLSLTPIVSGLNSPIGITNANDASRRLFIVEQGGRIRIVKGTTLVTTPYLDIHTRVSCCGERGLLGLAFHPSYRSNGKFYVDYTDVNGNTVIAEYHKSSTNPDRASTTERVLLRIKQPYSNHNGGQLAFGPDGYLYIAMGDGGSQGDPGNRAQSLGSLLGKILRIDVNHRTGTKQYAVPGSNPFVNRYGYDEIWAYGLRNPWRFSFDRKTGDLYIGDVGQDNWEEVDRALKTSGSGRGRNYGWHVLEGRACYNPPSGCSSAGMTPPFTVYDHSLGCAVTGGYVYRGGGYPILQGAYLFGDYCSGRIWALNASGPGPQTPIPMLDTSLNISSFGEGQAGEIYLADLGGGDIYRVAASPK